MLSNYGLKGYGTQRGSKGAKGIKRSFSFLPYRFSLATPRRWAPPYRATQGPATRRPTRSPTRLRIHPHRWPTRPERCRS